MVSRPVTLNKQQVEEAEFIIIQLTDPDIAHFLAEDFRDAGFKGTVIFLQPGEDVYTALGFTEK